MLRRGDTPSKHSITGRLFRVAFQYYILVAIALTGLLVIGEYLSARSALREEMRTYQHAFAGPLASALWAIDTTKLDAIATGMIEIPAIFGVRISDPTNGHVFVTATTHRGTIRVGRDDELEAVWAELARNAVVRHTFAIPYTHETGTTVLGHAELLSSWTHLVERIKGQASLIFAISLFKEMVLWGIFLLAGQRLLGRPLRQLIAALGSNQPDRPAKIVFPPDTARTIAGTELMVVRDVFNALVDRVSDQRAQLLAANSRLEDQVAERTQALEQANRSLQENAQRLTASNTELEQFAYVASHDLRQPLRMVASYMALLERQYGDRLDDDARTFIGFARDGAARMDRLILDLLSLSRIGRTDKTFQPTPFARVAADALRPLEEDLGAVGGKVTIAPDLPVVMGDSDELVRLMTNLVGNALKYRSPDRAIEIAIGWNAGRDGQPVLWVRDNGIGIAPEHYDRVFLIFQRLQAGTTCEGTGIGLAICKKIVERHGGRIWVDSTVGSGSTFFFTLPAA